MHFSYDSTLAQLVLHRQILGTNTHGQGSSPPLNTTTYYTHISQAESQQFRCFETTPEMVTAWLVRVNRKGWIERLGGAA